jgi:long-chain acyl-CoA synthetase
MNTFGSPIRRANTCFSDRPALVDIMSGDVHTFGEVAERVSRIVAFLQHQGLKAGDRVAVLAEGSPRYAELYQAVPMGGFILVTLNTRYTPSELQAACSDCSPRVLFTDRPSESVNGLAPIIIAMHADLDGLLNTMATPDPTTIDEGDPAVIFYTGGTTDRAKGVVLSHRSKLADATSLITSVDLRSDDRWLVMSPMFHAAGSFNILPCVWVGASQYFLPRFDAESALRAIETYRLSITFGVPTMLQALADAQRRIGADVSSVRLLGHGGAPITSSVLHDTMAAFPTAEICSMYGSTETAPLVTVGRHQELLTGTEEATSAGIPVIGVDVDILDPGGDPVEPGQIGEIVVTGPNLMSSYWNKDEATADVLRLGSYWSGDLGRMDEHGNLYVVDRRKDMIITGGENVFSTEVEDALTSHPQVAEAAVIGAPDDRWGELVVAVVVTAGTVPEEELDQHCRVFLAGYKVPRRYVFRDDPLPRSAAGKLLKRELRSNLG